jgi:hypothetical protein
MLAGLLVSLTLVYLLCPKCPTLTAARAVALTTVAMGFGGSMTYGQTLGLTQDPDLVGNWAALRWGLLGTTIKGAIWIGLAGVFLGMALSGVRHTWKHLFALMALMLAGHYLGVWLFNSPFDPANRRLPALYFSASWDWTPEKEFRPRYELWGGLLVAWVVAVCYCAFYRKDTLARNMALWGFLGGGLGFTGGQCLQAYHAWNLEWFREGFLSAVDPKLNWWNNMETTFGAIMGATLGLGLWLNRDRIEPDPEPYSHNLPLSVEWILLGIHLPLLIAVEFLSVDAVDALYDLGLILGFIPIVAIAGGRWWPYLQMFPLFLLPMAGKTVQQLAYEESPPPLPAEAVWVLYFVVPITLAAILAVVFAMRAKGDLEKKDFVRRSLLFSVWLYFLLNYAFFRFPFPSFSVEEWTGRTFNGLVFTVMALGLTLMALLCDQPEEKA